MRRLGTTPVPLAWMLAAQVAINLALAVAALVIVVVAGTVGFGLGAPREPGGFTLALALSIAALFAIGLWISAIARSQNAAMWIGQLLWWPTLFFAGLLFPVALPAVLRDIGDWTPSGAAVHALQDSWPAPSRPRSCCWCWPAGRWCSGSWPCASSGGSSTSRLSPVRQNENEEVDTAPTTEGQR